VVENLPALTLLVHIVVFAVLDLVAAFYIGVANLVLGQGCQNSGKK
jgi:hypothetical protein